MPKSSPLNFDGELRVFTIGAERVAWLGSLIATSRSDFKPRDSAERYLVDDMALCRWRGLRVALMEKAVFEQQSTSFRPRNPKDADGRRLMPHEDICHLAMAYAPEAHATVLAALNRLDSRYYRQFCSSLRLLLTLRRGSPPPVATEPTSASTKPVPTKPVATQTALGKEIPTCEPSSITPPTT